MDRLRYILAHGPKENLVERVLDWPGVHAAKAILEDKPLTGYWFDRSQDATELLKAGDRSQFL